MSFGANHDAIAAAKQLYASVRHILDDAEAGKKIGRSKAGVIDYRKHHPEAQPKGWLEARRKRNTRRPVLAAPVRPPKPQTPSGGPENAVWRKRVPLANGGSRTISVSLAGPKSMQEGGI